MTCILSFLQLSKTDISAPTRTMGPLFNGEEAPEDSEELRRVSLALLLFTRVAILLLSSLFYLLQLSLPSPGEDIAALTKNTKHRR